jgi:ribose transport system substrate-binding protein
MRQWGETVMTCGKGLISGIVGVALALGMGSGAALAGGGGIALSNSYTGNSWRQEMLRLWNFSAQQGVNGNVIGKTIVVNAGNSAPRQAAQIADLVKGGWNAIAIDAASPTGLNDAIQQACDAHIVVVVFDSLATAPCAYKIAYNYVTMGGMEAWYVANQLHGTGNVLEVRGVAGTSVDDDIHEGIVQGLASYPGIKLVGSVHGDWTESIARKAVATLLPSLPKVDAVVTQGGDAYGAYEAFAAAGRPTPLIIMGNRQDELALWKKLSEAPGGYQTFSVSSPPGVSSIAFWVAQQVLAGTQVPKTIVVPWLIITQDTLDAWLKAVPPDGVASPVYGQQWTESLIAATVAHTGLPPSPEPGAMP